MKIITCASYYGSGSSVITDFVSEFENVQSFTDEEFRFLQDPDGVSDLEYNLVENFNRHNSGHALKRFEKLARFYAGNKLTPRYSRILGESWANNYKKYVEKLTDFSYHGWWQYDLMDKGNLFYFRKRLINKIFQKTIWHANNERTLNTMKNEITLCSHPSEARFLSATRDFVDSVFSSESLSKSISMVDQLVPPSNLQRYLRYFNNVQVVIVDRDPRDIFLLEKYIWKDGVIPQTPELFCKWFLYTRDNRNIDELNSDNVRYVQFEDMVFDYDSTTTALMEWLGLNQDEHIHLKELFNPALSSRNTRLWERIDHNPDDVAYIEDKLQAYLYHE